MKKVLISAFLLMNVPVLRTQNCLYFDGVNDYLDINTVQGS